MRLPHFDCKEETMNYVCALARRNFVLYYRLRILPRLHYGLDDLNLRSEIIICLCLACLVWDVEIGFMTC